MVPKLIQVSASEVRQNSPEQLMALCTARLERASDVASGGFVSAIREALEIFRNGGTFRNGLLEEALAELAGLESAPLTFRGEAVVMERMDKP